MAESKEGLKSLLMKVKEVSEKVGLKVNIQETKIMASGPITSRQMEIEKWRQWQIFFPWALMIIVDSGCSHEIKRPLFLGRKTTTNIDSILKKQHILLTKLCIVKGMFFSSHFYECESWTIKKAEHWRTDAFKLFWRRFLRVPWTARRSNQLILKEINPK